MKKALAIVLVLILSTAILAGCGGSGDALQGTWEGTYDDGNATWVFDGKGGCKLTNAFTSNLSGQYTITDATVDIKLDSWDTAKTYNFKIDGSRLTLEATDVYSPSYDLVKK